MNQNLRGIRRICIVFSSIKLIVLSVAIRLPVVVLEVFHLHPVSYLTVMAQVLPVSLAIITPNGLVVIIRGTVYGDAASGSTNPVEGLIVVLIVTGNVLSRTTQSMRIANDTITPVGKAGTHYIISSEVLVVRVGNHHNRLLVGRVSNVGCAVQVPNHVTRNLPRILSTRGLPGTEVLGHQFQSVIIDQIGGHSLSLGIFAHSEVALDEQVHTAFLVYLTHVCHLGLWRHVLYGKLQIVNQHLEDGLLAGRCIVTLRHADKFRHQGDIAKLQCQIVVSIGTMEIGAALIGIACGIIQALHLVHIRQDGVGILHHAVALIPETLHVVGITSTGHTRGRSELGIEVVLETTAHIGLGIHAYIRHQIVGEDTHIVPVTVYAVRLQLFVTLCQGGLQTSLCAIGGSRLVE